MKKRVLFGIVAGTLVAFSAAVAGPPVATPELDGYNYEPGIDGNAEWGFNVGVLGAEDTDLPAVQQNTIESVKFEEMPALNGGFLFIPPDPHAAVGPNHIVTIVNCSIQWYLKTGGAPQNQQPLGKQVATITNAFFNSLTPVNALFDPKIIYDQYSGRFFVVALEQVGGATMTSRLLFAVSDDSDPNGTWYFSAINSEINIAGTDYWFDYPGLACDQNVIYVTGNYFNYPGTMGAASRLWILNKAPFYSGGALTLNPGSPFDAAAASGFPNSTMQPAQMFGTPPVGVGTYLCLYSGLTSAPGIGGLEFFQTIRVDNPTGVPVFTGDQAAMGDIDIASGTLPRGNQPGSINTATRIDTGDRRCLAALWRNGHIYGVFHVNPPVGVNAGQNTAHWVKEAITTGAGTVVDQGDIGGEEVSVSAWTNYPSIGVDKLGNMAICVGIGSPTTFASAAYTTRSAADPPGFLNPLTVYASGNAFYRRTFSSNTAARNRWGDYSATVVDPDACIFWSYHEYAGTTGTPTTVGTVTEDGRWWTRAVSYYVDDDRNGLPDGCQAVAVVLARFEAVREGNGAKLSWTVTEEHDHLGFNIFRETEGGARVILNVGILSGRTEYEFVDEGAPEDGATYWLQEVERSGITKWLGSINLEPASSRPVIAELRGARPNPFNASTTLEFSLSQSRAVHLAVFDIQGRKVATLLDGVQDAGSHSVTWDGRSDGGVVSPSGFYFFKLQADGVIKNQKVVLNRGGTEGFGGTR
ncbi:MAG: FlgD immunoglobulin-like domain containing protein [Candidatus Eisenbacteria bacterium]|nr:FlgD immunoglobulin-like domain containing protein [Candidatus Eisenbacteria bacterium]